MVDIITVKAAIINLLRNDSSLQSLLTKDSNGNWPVYHSLIQHTLHKPCVTIEDALDQGEVSGLNDSYDGSKSYEWREAQIQIDCWSTSGPEERDRLQATVQKCLLKKANQEALRSSDIIEIKIPVIRPLDDVSVNPPLWRKSLSYKVFYILDS